MKVSFDYALDIAMIEGVPETILHSFEQSDLVIIQNSVVYTDIGNLGFVLGWLSDTMTIEIN